MVVQGVVLLLCGSGSVFESIKVSVEFGPGSCPPSIRRRYGLNRSDEEEEDEEKEEGGASRGFYRSRYSRRSYLNDSDNEDKPSKTTA
ncbi:unconventional myosin-XVIIIa [Arapaima gigas]